MLSKQPKAGHERPELAPELRSFPLGNYLLFYLPLRGGIDLVRVPSSPLGNPAMSFKPFVKLWTASKFASRPIAGTVRLQ